LSYEDIFRAVDSLRNKTETSSLLSLSAGFPFSGPDGAKSVLSISQILPILKRPSLPF